MIINELGDSPIRSGNVYFANNEQATLVFFRKLLTIFRSVLCEIQANQSSCSPLNISQTINVE